MDRLEGIHYTKWNKSDREGYKLYDIIYMWNLKIQQTSEYNKKEADRYIENILVVTPGERGGAIQE